MQLSGRGQGLVSTEGMYHLGQKYWDSNMERSHSFKEEKYAPLIADLLRDFTVFNYSVEVSARGQITKDNKAPA